VRAPRVPALIESSENTCGKRFLINTQLKRHRPSHATIQITARRTQRVAEATGGSILIQLGPRSEEAFALRRKDVLPHRSTVQHPPLKGLQGIELATC
jgi:hypothetical protein